MMIDIAVQQNLYVTTENLHMRLGPGIQHESINIMKKGCIVEIYEKVGNWAYLGGGCWCCSDYLEKYQDDITWKATTTANLNIRSGPGTNYYSKGILKKGTTVKVIKERNNWFYVQYKNKKFWLSGLYLK